MNTNTCWYVAGWGNTGGPVMMKSIYKMDITTVQRACRAIRKARPEVTVVAFIRRESYDYLQENEFAYNVWWLYWSPLWKYGKYYPYTTCAIRRGEYR